MSDLRVVLSADNSGLVKACDEAKNVLNKYKDSAKKASGEIEKNSSVTNSQVKAYERVNKALERATSGAVNSQKAQKMLTSSVRELQIQWANLSDEAKRNDFGKAIENSLKSAKDSLKQLDAQLEATAPKLKGGGGGFDFKGMAMGALKLGGTIGVATTAFNLFKGAVADNIQTARGFEKAVSSIRALTGASEETMNQLKQSAIDLGGSTMQTASDVMKAFGMIGSKSPELLKSADNLSEVTKNVIMLSEASEVELEDAATTVTGVLNMFGISANRSAEVVNLLAAASQQGAGNVRFLGDAIVKCGSTAGALGVSVNEVVAQLEMLAQSGMDASTSGNNLKNILLTLESSTNQNLKPSVVGLNQAIKNLSEMNLDAVATTKMFGKENVAAVLTLTKMAEKADDLTKAITGTNTAEQQQRLNQDNLEGSIASLSSKWEKFNLTINQSNGGLKTFVDWLGSVVDWMTEIATTTDLATEAIKKFNKENGSTNDSYKDNNKTKNQQAKEFNKRKHALEKDIADTQRRLNGFKKGEKDTSRGKVVQQQQAVLRKAEEIKLKAYRKEYNELLKEGKEFFYGNSTTKTTPTKTTTTTTSGGTGSGSSGSHTSKTTKGATFANGSLSDLEKQLSDLQSKYKDGLLPNLSKDDYKTKVADLEKKIKEKKVELGIDDEKLIAKSDEAKKKLDEKFADLMKPRSQSSYEKAVGEPETKTNKDKLNDLKQEMDYNDKLADQLRSLLGDYEKLGEIGSESYNKVKKALSDLEGKQEGLSDETKGLVKEQKKQNTQLKRQEKNLKAVADTSSAIGTIGSAFSNLGGAIDSADGKTLQFIGTSLDAVSQIIPAVMSLIGAKEGEAIASGVAGAAKLPFPASLASIASIVAAITSVFAGLASFSEGGIFNAPTSIGDMSVARVNSGEMILNGRQQKRLFALLNNGYNYNGFGAQPNGKVDFKIRGTKLQGVLKNTDRKRNRV